MLLACPHCLSLNRIAEQRLTDKPVCGHCKKNLFTGQPIEGSSKNFARLVEQSELPVVIDFWASWCGPCKSFAPIFAQAAVEMEPHFRFVKINTEQQQALAARFTIRSIPALMIWRNGKPVAQQAGALTARDFYQWLAQFRQ